MLDTTDITNFVELQDSKAELLNDMLGVFGKELSATDIKYDKQVTKDIADILTAALEYYTEMEKPGNRAVPYYKLKEAIEKFEG